MFKWFRKPVTWGGLIVAVMLSVITGLTSLAVGIIKYFKLERMVKTFLKKIKSEITEKLKK